MRSFLFRCPMTGAVVQGSTPLPAAPGQYVSRSCPACGRIHIVDPITGKLATGSQRDESKA